MSIIRATIPGRDVVLTIDGVSGPIEAMVESDIGPLLVYLPPWCLRLRVECTPDSEERSLAFTAADPEYRQARIGLRPLYLMEPDVSARRATLAHEIAHLLLWQATAHHDNMVRELTQPDTPLRKIAEDALRVAQESSTEDVARALLAAIGGGNG